MCGVTPDVCEKNVREELIWACRELVVLTRERHHLIRGTQLLGEGLN